MSRWYTEQLKEGRELDRLTELVTARLQARGLQVQASADFSEEDADDVLRYFAVQIAERFGVERALASLQKLSSELRSESA